MKFHVYKDKKKEWRWRLVSRKKIVADSGEGYKRRVDCVKTIKSIQKRVASAEIII